MLYALLKLQSNIYFIFENFKPISKYKDCPSGLATRPLGITIKLIRAFENMKCVDRQKIYYTKDGIIH